MEFLPENWNASTPITNATVQNLAYTKYYLFS